MATATAKYPPIRDLDRPRLPSRCAPISVRASVSPEHRSDMSSIVPSDRQLLLASRAALAAGSRLQSGDPELTALFDAADTALGVLIGRTAISAQPSGPLSAGLINLVARGAVAARPLPGSTGRGGC